MKDLIIRELTEAELHMVSGGRGGVGHGGWRDRSIVGGQRSDNPKWGAKPAPSFGQLGWGAFKGGSGGFLTGNVVDGLRGAGLGYMDAAMSGNGNGDSNGPNQGGNR